MLDFELFIKYFSGKANFEEAMLIEDFARSSPDKYAYFQAIYKSWTVAGEEDYQLPDVKKEWEDFNTQLKITERKPKKLLKFRKMAFAATIIGLLGISGVILSYLLNKPSASIRITASQKEFLILSDSSILSLHPGATLTHPEKFLSEARVIHLSGNADFRVKYHASQPFIIHLPNDLNIRVTGTAFSVIQTTEDVKVILKQGGVIFYNKSDSVHMAAGQTAAYLLKERKFLLESSIPEFGSFDFNSQPLNEVISDLNTYFHSEVQLVNPRIGNCLFSGSFKDQKLTDIVNIIAITFNFEYKPDGTKIWIDGEACN